MSFAIFRFEKLKSFGAIASSGGHVRRTRPALNVDSNKFELNQYAPGEISTLDRVKSRLPDKVRRNGVMAVELLMTASPEFFQNKKFAEVEEWKAASLEWARKTFGEENLVDWGLHLDETTPHIHAYVVPIDPKGKLNASHWFDGKVKCSGLQDSYAAAMDQFSLQRGIRKSGARHQDIQKYYTHVNSSLEQMDKHLDQFNQALRQTPKPSIGDMLNFKDWLQTHLYNPIQKLMKFFERVYLQKKNLEMALDQKDQTADRLREDLKHTESKLNRLAQLLGFPVKDLNDPEKRVSIEEGIKQGMNAYTTLKRKQQVE